ncbi:MAG: TAXI family TRAP transporter solute-binding subunit [Chloroflexota bacterium]
MMRKTTLLATIVAMTLVTGCAAPRASAPTATPPGTAAAIGTAAATGTAALKDYSGRAVTVVTGPTGGVYIVYGAGIANILTNKLKVSGTAQSTTASVDNMKLIRDKKADLALTLPDVAFDAVKGRGRFAPPETPAKAKALAVLYTNFFHLVTKDGIGINTPADLKGKRVSVGAAGSGTEVKGLRVIEAYGLQKSDLQAQSLGPADSAAALKDGKIDAFFWDGGLPTAAITDLVNTASFKVKFLSHTDAVAKMSSKYGPFYFVATIPKGTYKNDEDIKVAGVANLLVAHDDMEDDLAYQVLKTLFDNKTELGTVHVEAKNLKLETAVAGSPLDYHPGAIKFFRDKGVWKK